MNFPFIGFMITFLFMFPILLVISTLSLTSGVLQFWSLKQISIKFNIEFKVYENICAFLFISSNNFLVQNVCKLLNLTYTHEQDYDEIKMHYHILTLGY